MDIILPEPDPALDTIMIIVAELLRSGAFDSANLAGMARRLDLIGLPEIGERILSLPICNAMDSPEALRSGIHIIGGGNGID